ncbi:MAG: MBL fold metallo-hydrolase [Deltaproteobacteria bacterium]|nr:MBL fold metallo-hydrolase [Deltaproteobacteria bacterium]
MNGNAQFTRRGFLVSTSCLGAAIAMARYLPAPAMAAEVATDARVAAQPLADKGFASVRKIGDGVYATISDLSKGLTTTSNGGFIVGKESALMIEGFRQPAGAEFQMEALRSVSRVPVQAAVDTHYHFDHSMGNSHYGAQGIPVWAHEKTAAMMALNYGSLQGTDKTDKLSALEKQAREAPTEAEREHAKGDLNAYKLVFATMDSTMIGLPTRPLEVSKLPLTVDLGGVKAVIEARPGHTPTDLIVRIPDRNIVFTGDLLFNLMYPATFDADLRAWEKTLLAFSGYDKETLFVPGHGPVCGPEGVERLRDVFGDLTDQARKMYKAGIPVEEAKHRYVIPARFKGFAVFSWGFCIAPAIAKLYEEFKLPTSPRSSQH